MQRSFQKMLLGDMQLANKYVFPPIKLAYTSPEGIVSDEQLRFYDQIAAEGPGLIISEPVPVTIDGKEHPKQLLVHLPQSEQELKKIADVVHAHNRLVCLHLNHAGAAANPMASESQPKAPSSFKCPSSGQTAQVLSQEEIQSIVEAYLSAGDKAVNCGFDALEIQAGHGYLISQFLNSKLNTRTDSYGQDRLLFAKQVISALQETSAGLPVILRISGKEMSAEYGLSQEDLLPLLELAEDSGICAIHVGMGNACFSPPWYFHHGSLPVKPQLEALAWIRDHTSLPLIVAGRMGRPEKIIKILDENLADLIALGRPLIADPDLLQKWMNDKEQEAIYCGYCLQGCLHRVKNGKSIGCNVNPAMAKPEYKPTKNPLNVLVAGGGPAGMSAAFYLSRRGHRVHLAEKEQHLGGQFSLAWQAPGKENMKACLDSFEQSLARSQVNLLLGKRVDLALVQEIKPDLLVWSVGAVQNIPDIPGLESTYHITGIEYFTGGKEVKGPRVLVIGAGRTGLEIAEKLGHEGYEVVATKRTDPLGSMMEMITRNLILKKIEGLKNVVLMPHTTVMAFKENYVDLEQDGVGMSMQPFQTVILASGMLSAAGPDNQIRSAIPRIETIGDAYEVRDIFSAMQAGYNLAITY